MTSAVDKSDKHPGRAHVRRSEPPKVGLAERLSEVRSLHLRRSITIFLFQLARRALDWATKCRGLVDGLSGCSRAMMNRQPVKPVPFSDLVFPPRHLRWGGTPFNYDLLYLESARSDLRRLAELCHLSSRSKVLDIGCASGRLWTGILSEYGSVAEYVGVDCRRESVEWAQKNLSDLSRGASFHFTNIRHERYNREGEPLKPDWTFPVSEEHFDVVAAFSVFSHMHFVDSKVYLREIGRVLNKKGRAFLTVHVEEGGEPETVDPPECDTGGVGPLCCVRLNRQIFEVALRQVGLEIVRRVNAPVSKGESLYIVSPASSGN